MKFDDLDAKMRCYEESIDQKVLPDMYLVARLDGRSFSRLMKIPLEEKCERILSHSKKLKLQEKH